MFLKITRVEDSQYCFCHQMIEHSNILLLRTWCIDVQHKDKQNDTYKNDAQHNGAQQMKVIRTTHGRMILIR